MHIETHAQKATSMIPHRDSLKRNQPTLTVHNDGDPGISQVNALLIDLYRNANISTVVEIIAVVEV